MTNLQSEYEELNEKAWLECDVKITDKGKAYVPYMNRAAYDSRQDADMAIRRNKIDQLKAVIPVTSAFRDALHDSSSGEYFAATRMPWSVFQRELSNAFRAGGAAHKKPDRRTEQDEKILGLLPIIGDAVAKWPEQSEVNWTSDAKLPYRTMQERFSIRRGSLYYKSSGKQCGKTVTIDGEKFMRALVLYKMHYRSVKGNNMAVVDRAGELRTMAHWKELEAVSVKDAIYPQVVKKVLSRWFTGYVKSGGDVYMTVDEQVEANKRFAKLGLQDFGLFHRMAPLWRTQLVLTRLPWEAPFENVLRSPEKPQPPVKVQRKYGGLKTPDYRDRNNIVAEYEPYSVPGDGTWLVKKGYGPIEDRIVKSRYIKRKHVKWRTSDVLYTLMMGVIKKDQVVLHFRASFGDFSPNMNNLFLIPKNVAELYPLAFEYYKGGKVDFKQEKKA